MHATTSYCPHCGEALAIALFAATSATGAPQQSSNGGGGGVNAGR